MKSSSTSNRSDSSHGVTGLPSLPATPFQFFNPAAPVEITHQNLPHWEQVGATYFITFRTKDSIPKDVMDRWMTGRREWLERHGINPGDLDLSWQIECLPDLLRKEYHQQFTSKWHDNLDECHGACVLRDAGLACVIADSLLHFDGVRCAMGDFVIMPNHVHLLAGIPGRGAMRRLCYSWKKYTSTEINKRIGGTGEFWQPESFDHIVRNAGSFEKFRKYIADNPKKARLKAGEFHWHQWPAEGSPSTP